jgi:hypothetical protein
MLSLLKSGKIWSVYGSSGAMSSILQEHSYETKVVALVAPHIAHSSAEGRGEAKIEL